MTTTESTNRTMIEVAGHQVEMFSGGSGPPLLFLHGAGGNAGWQAYHEELAKSYTVYVPSRPASMAPNAPTGSTPSPTSATSITPWRRPWG